MLTYKCVHTCGMVNVRRWWKWVAKISSMSVMSCLSHSRSCCYTTLRCETWYCGQLFWNRQMCEYRTIAKKQHIETRCPPCLSDYLRGSDRKTTGDIAGENRIFVLPIGGKCCKLKVCINNCCMTHSAIIKMLCCILKCMQFNLKHNLVASHI